MEETGHLIKQRREKVDELRARGISPFNNKFKVNAKIGSLVGDYSDFSKEELAEKDVACVVAGRMMTRRDHGKTTFIHMKDRTGQIQVFVNEKALGKEPYEIFGKLDIGDIVGVQGKVSKTRTGELTLFAESLTLLTKSLQPLPEKWHGLKDIELRYRQRYVDLIVNPEVKQIFVYRSRIIQAIRDFLNDRDYMEVETPDDAFHPWRGDGKTFQDPPQCPEHGTLSQNRSRSFTSSGWWWGASSGFTRSIAVSATKASRRSIILSSPCWSSTPPTSIIMI